jgi:3',5'-cyclic AMP phosphodiesterase CpdA
VNANPPTLIAQLTDMHVVEPDSTAELWVDNTARLHEAVASIGGESPAVSAVLATGDLTSAGRPGEYEVLADALDPLRVQVLPIPGNHDDRALIRETFPAVPWADAAHASWVSEVGGVRLVGLDSIRPGEPGAAFDAPREDWLRAQLATPIPRSRPGSSGWTVQASSASIGSCRR